MKNLIATFLVLAGIVLSQTDARAQAQGPPPFPPADADWCTYIEMMMAWNSYWLGQNDQLNLVTWDQIIATLPPTGFPDDTPPAPPVMPNPPAPPAPPAVPPEMPEPPSLSSILGALLLTAFQTPPPPTPPPSLAPIMITDYGEFWWLLTPQIYEWLNPLGTPPEDETDIPDNFDWGIMASLTDAQLQQLQDMINNYLANDNMNLAQYDEEDC